MSEVSADSDKGKVLAQPGIHFAKPKGNSLLYIGVAVIVLALLLTLYFIFVQGKAQAVCTSKDNNYLLQTAAQNLYSASALKPTSDQIQKLANYQKDPNCLYVVVNYYIDAGDATDAKAYLDKLNKVYDSKKGLSSEFGDAKSVKQLQTDINNLNQVQNMFNKEIKLYGQPPPQPSSRP